MKAPIFYAALLATLQCLTISPGAIAQAPTADAAVEAAKMESAIPVARETLPQLRPLVNEQTYRQLGFESVEEISAAKLGTPMPVYMVRLDQLREYKPGEKPERLMIAGNEAIFPVLVGDQVRTGMKLRDVDGKWRFSSFGASAVVKAIAKTAKTVSAQPPRQAGSQFVLTIPAFNVYFLGHSAPEGVILTPVADDERFDLREGHSLPASVALSQMAPYARKYKTSEHLVD